MQKPISRKTQPITDFVGTQRKGFCPVMPSVQQRQHPEYKRWSACLLLALAVPIAACGEGDPVSLSTDMTKKSFQQIKGHHALMVMSGAADNSDAEGAQSSGQELSGADHVYRPASGTGRATYIRKGSNADGPYSFVIYTEAVHDDKPDAAARTLMTINLPENAKPGSYSVAAFKDAAPDQAQARISGAGYGWNFARNIDGVVDVLELGDELSAAWDFTAQDAKKRGVQVSGAVKNLAFTPQMELTYHVDVNGENHENRTRSGYNKKNNFVTLYGGSPAIYVGVPVDISAGEHAIGQRKDKNVHVNLPKLEFDHIDGQVRITENGEEYVDVAFEFKTKGEHNVTGKGTYRYVPVDLLRSDS